MVNWRRAGMPDLPGYGRMENSMMSPGMFKGEWSPSATIAEGQSALVVAPQDQLSAEVNKLDRVCVRDQTGRVWKGKIIAGQRRK